MGVHKTQEVHRVVPDSLRVLPYNTCAYHLSGMHDLSGLRVGST